ncbi:arylsulfatase B-like [Teleopsis dalmanni]|uniref:arylsulfatase B-like n=1 Tax=Teleopsis dalmanni TaxID=139649 RepID=UPI0018CEC7E5|nr:arylsulfatase B-like [Teleopsis dalmanni]
MLYGVRLKMIFCLLKILSIFIVNNAEAKIKQPTSPHIIMILADDMGFDDVSFHGAKEFLTPNIDALAYHGRILDRLYAPSMCTPSRSALLTGKYPIHTGTQHFVISNEEPWGLSTNVTTAAEIFKKAGYATNLVGKWHLGFAKTEYTPTYRGFDYHYGYWGGFIDYYQRRSKMPVPNYNMGYDFRRNLNLECDKLDTYVTDLFTNEAERIIINNKNTKPLFLLVNHLAPHSGNEDNPLQAPAEEIRKFKHIKDPNRRIYAAMISKLDESVGRITAALERANMLENSIIIFYSDNGAPSVGLFSNTGKNWPLRGQKNTPWEGGVRVTGAIWSPLIEARASIFKQPIYVGDWLPTLAEAAGVELPKDFELDGISLWSELKNDNTETNYKEREIVHNLDDIWNVVSYMRGPWKYINGTTSNGAYDNLITYREEYDVDPRELRYVVEVRNSATSKALRKYDKYRLTMYRIEQLRDKAAVKCGNLQRSCNALLEECLFNLNDDPCEQNNLVWDTAYKNILNDMRESVESYRKSATKPRNLPGQLEYDPSRHNCAWTNFLEEAPTNNTLDCGYHGPPCLETTDVGGRNSIIHINKFI